MKNMIKKVTLLVISLIVLAYSLNAGKDKVTNFNDDIRLRNGCLSFSGFRYVDNIKLEQALQQILQKEKNVRKLNLESCRVDNINLGNLSCLKELNLKSCKVDNINLGNLVYLEELNLIDCDYLEKLNINNCPNLKTIMVDCCLFRPQEIIINRCPKLRKLDILISHITDQQLDQILDQVGQTLETLSINNCKNLHHINLDKCPNVGLLCIHECKLNNIEEINTIVKERKIYFSHD